MLLLLASACARGGGGGDEDQPQAKLDPAFPPVEAAPDGGAAAGDGSPTTAPGAAPSGEASPPTPGKAGGAAPPTEPGATQGVITDAVGDVTPTPLDPAPKFADLAGAVLIRRIDGFELRVRLGDTAPSKSPDGDHTMNIASFYDIDGDGTINFEVWLNLGPNGWGGSWFDNDTEQAKFQDEAQLDFTVEGSEVVVKFPVGHIGGAKEFRWSLASEYGRYEAIGTVGMARDDAPDNDQPAAFPG